MKSTAPLLAVLGMTCLLVTTTALAFVVQETDYEIPNSLVPVPPNILPEFATSGYRFTREYNSEALNDGWVGFGWTWDLIGLKGFSSGIANYMEGLSVSTTENLSDGSSWQFDVLTSQIDFSYYNISSVLLGTFRLEFNSDDRITRFTDYLGYQTSYSYSSAGDLVAVTDVFGNQTRYEYDSNHRLLARIDPFGNRTDFPIPEPSVFALIGLGLAGIGYQRHRNKYADNRH